MTEFRKLDVLVVVGGISHERDVSLRSGRRITDALQAAGHRVTVREPDGTLLDHLAEHRPDVVWPVLHGASGEDGALRALLELAQLRYVGSDPKSSRLAWTKPVAKTLVERAGVRTARSIALPRDAVRELTANDALELVGYALEFPLVVKPAQGGSAQGLSFVTEPGELSAAVMDAYTYGDVALIEKEIRGTEVSVGIVELDGETVVLPAVEIVPRSGRYTFEARYTAGETRFFTPARLAPGVEERAAHAALAAHTALGLRHLSRIDFIVDEDGEPNFLEANVFPGFTETSVMPLAIEGSGRTLTEVCSELSLLVAS